MLQFADALTLDSEGPQNALPEVLIPHLLGYAEGPQLPFITTRPMACS